MTKEVNFDQKYKVYMCLSKKNAPDHLRKKLLKIKSRQL